MKPVYPNGQKVYEFDGDRLIYYFKNGKVKAEGPYKNNLMEGDWKFYRENGKLWQICRFYKGENRGILSRFNINGEPEEIESTARVSHKRRAASEA